MSAPNAPQRGHIADTAAPSAADTCGGLVRLFDEWQAMADELFKSAIALEDHAETLRQRARIARDKAWTYAPDGQENPS